MTKNQIQQKSKKKLDFIEFHLDLKLILDSTYLPHRYETKMNELRLIGRGLGLPFGRPIILGKRLLIPSYETRRGTAGPPMPTSSPHRLGVRVRVRVRVGVIVMVGVGLGLGRRATSI